MRATMLLLGLGMALAASGCTVSARSPFGDGTPEAALAAVRALLARGADPDAFDDEGMTPLLWTCGMGATEAMRALLDAGADPNARDRRTTHWPALLHAIHGRQADAVRLLLEHGADPNLGTPDGFSPLMAAAQPDPAILEDLLAYGADPRAMSGSGDTALTVAISGASLADADRPLLGGCFTKSVRALLTHDPGLRLPNTSAGHHARFWARLRRCEDVLGLVR